MVSFACLLYLVEEISVENKGLQGKERAEVEGLGHRGEPTISFSTRPVFAKDRKTFGTWEVTQLASALPAQKACPWSPLKSLTSDNGTKRAVSYLLACSSHYQTYKWSVHA